QIPGQIEKAVQAIDEWITGSAELKQSNDDLTKTLSEQLKVAQQLQNQYELIGLTGSASVSRQIEQLKSQIATGNAAVSSLYDNLDRLKVKQAGEQGNAAASALGGSFTPYYDPKLDAQIKEQQNAIDAQNGSIDNLNRSLMALYKNLDLAF